MQQAARRFADLMALVPGGVAVIDSGGVVVDASTELGALLDAPARRSCAACRRAPSPPSRTCSTSRWPGACPGWLRPVPPGARYGYRLESVPLRRGDGSTVWCELAVSTTASDDGGWFWLVVCTDTSERRQAAQAAEQLRSAGSVDELTRLPNRAARSSRCWTGTWPGRAATGWRVVCGNLDDFQRVNSSLGHDAGDEMLVDWPAGCSTSCPSGAPRHAWAATSSS